MRGRRGGSWGGLGDDGSSLWESVDVVHVSVSLCVCFAGKRFQLQVIDYACSVIGVNGVVSANCASVNSSAITPFPPQRHHATTTHPFPVFLRIDSFTNSFDPLQVASLSVHEGIWSFALNQYLLLPFAFCLSCLFVKCRESCTSTTSPTTSREYPSR